MRAVVPPRAALGGAMAEALLVTVELSAESVGAVVRSTRGWLTRGSTDGRSTDGRSVALRTMPREWP